MIYSLLADAVLAFHFLFILFVVLGGLLVLQWRWVIYLHLPAAVWGAIVEFFHLRCPLTPWEIHFRKLAGQNGYETSFIEHYLYPIIYPPNLTFDMQIILGSIVVGLNLLVYSGIFFYGKR